MWRSHPLTFIQCSFLMDKSNNQVNPSKLLRKTKKREIICSISSSVIKLLNKITPNTHNGKVRNNRQGKWIQQREEFLEAIIVIKGWLQNGTWLFLVGTHDYTNSNLGNLKYPRSEFRAGAKLQSLPSRM